MSFAITKRVKKLDDRMQEMGYELNVLRYAQFINIMKKGWVLVIDERCPPAVAIWTCPRENLRIAFYVEDD